MQREHSNAHLGLPKASFHLDLSGGRFVYIRQIGDQHGRDPWHIQASKYFDEFLPSIVQRINCSLLYYNPALIYTKYQSYINIFLSVKYQILFRCRFIGLDNPNLTRFKQASKQPSCIPRDMAANVLATYRPPGNPESALIAKRIRGIITD